MFGIVVHIQAPSLLIDEEEIVKILTLLECVMLSPSFYMLIQLFFSISAKGGF